MWGLRQVVATEGLSTRYGKALLRRHRPDYQLILYAGILLAIGLIVLYAISPARVELMNLAGSKLNQAYFMQKQLLYLLIGIGAFIAAVWLPLKTWTRLAVPVLLVGLGLSLLLAVFGLFKVPLALEAGGAVRWFNLGIISFQPAEILKFGLLLYVAVFLGDRIANKTVNSFSETMLPLGMLLGLTMLFIVVLQKDMGTGIGLIGIVLTMLYVAGMSFRNFLLTISMLLGIGLLLVATSPHRVERVMTFFKPSAASDTAAGYHIAQAKIAIGSGGLIGKGLGQSVQAFGYLPEAVNDSIFAIMGEKFGFIGLVVILAVFFALLLRLIKLIDQTANPVWRLIVAGTFGWIATHTVVNIGAMIGIFPLTGVTLPFLSFGGTSLLFIMLALGITFHISRYASHGLANTINSGQGGGQPYAGFGGGRRLRRARHASGGGYQRA